VLVAMAVYVATMVVLAGAFDLRLVAPSSSGWGCTLRRCFILCRGWGTSANCDARSLTGRITDAYTNIQHRQTVLTTHREAAFARSAMREFMKTGHTQMRLVSAFEIVNHALSMV
jgi:ATP-binding cassette subfamily B multidrug efflux pump